MRRLTPKQKVFVEETIKTLNPTKAVRLVYDLGSKGGKQLQETARVIASQNLTKLNVQREFEKRLALIDDSKIVDEFYKIALGDNDLRAKLQAGVEILKLKQRYPKEQIDLELSKKREVLIEP